MFGRLLLMRRPVASRVALPPTRFGAFRSNPTPSRQRIRCLSSSIEAAGADKPIDYEFGLNGRRTRPPARFASSHGAMAHASGIESDLSDYRTRAPASARVRADAFARIADRVQTESHAHALADYANRRFGAAASGAGADSVSVADARKNAHFRVLARVLRPVSVDVARFDGEHVLSERIHKLMHLTLPSTAPATSTSTSAGVAGSRIEFDFGWKTERQKLLGRPGSGLTTFDARLNIRTLAAPATAAAATSDGDVEPVTVLAMTDCSCDFDDSTWNELHQRVAASHGGAALKDLSAADWAWFVSWFLTHPSDMAFDTVSGGLTGTFVNRFE